VEKIRPELKGRLQGGGNIITSGEGEKESKGRTEPQREKTGIPELAWDQKTTRFWSKNGKASAPEKEGGDGSEKKKGR